MADKIGVRLTLVSASPRRAELLRRLSVPFDVIPSRAAEHWAGPDASTLAIENARRKVERSSRFGDRSRLLLGADTLLQVNSQLLGKPAGAVSASQMLEKLSGREHEVITGVYITGPSEAGEGPPIWAEASVSSVVRFHELSRNQIREYIDSGEWRDKAGAYAIQGLGQKFVAHLDGDFDNVVGLPVQVIHDLLIEKFVHFRLC